MDRLSPEAYREAEKVPVVVVLDNVRSMNNVGSIFRTADALRIAEIYLCGITATPPHPEIHKTALGAEEVVSWKYFESTQEALSHLTRRGFEPWAVEQTHESTDIRALPTEFGRHPIALIFGNEVNGVQQAIINECRGSLEIPQRGTKHSLNVSVAAGIVMWTVVQALERR